MRIVYVEDNFPNQSLVERIVSSGKHEVISYPTAEDALHNFEKDTPHMMLIDIALAGPMTGLDLVRELRGRGYRRAIIAITAVSSERECLDAGCDAYFVKPVPVHELWQLIEQYAATV